MAACNNFKQLDELSDDDFLEMMTIQSKKETQPESGKEKTNPK